MPENVSPYLKKTYNFSRKIERSVFVPVYPPDKPLTTIGNHLLKRRLGLELEQKQVAELIGTDKCSIANWEQNRSRPRTRYLPKIIDFLGYTPKDLFKANTFAEKIRVYRQIHGLTQKQMADKLGIDPSTVIYLENEKHMPTKKLHEKIAKHIKSNI